MEINSTELDEAEIFNDTHDFDNCGTNFEELDRPISISEVENATRKLNRQKAEAGDHLLN